MAVELPLELLQWLYKVLLNEYEDPKKTYQDVCLILINYPSLKPRTRIYTNQYGTPQLLLNLYGALQNDTLNIPVDIWFPFEYPRAAPFIYVLPTDQVIIKPSNFVQQDGLIFHPFLYNWNTIEEDKSRRTFKILQLMGLIIGLLTSDPPYLSKPRRQPQLLQDQPLNSPPQLPPKPRAKPTITTLTSPERVASPTPPIYRELEQLSLIDQDNNSTNVPKLPPNPTRLQLLNNLKLKLSNISQFEIESLVNKEILPVLQNSTEDVIFWQNELLKIEQSQVYLHDKIESNNLILDEKVNQVISLNTVLKEQPEYNLDELIIAPTLQHQQIYNLITKDRAITDTISSLTKLYELEKMQLPQLMKFTRKLARDQFLTRALINKIVHKMNLRSSTSDAV